MRGHSRSITILVTAVDTLKVRIRLERDLPAVFCIMLNTSSPPLVCRSLKSVDIHGFNKHAV